MFCNSARRLSGQLLFVQCEEFILENVRTCVLSFVFAGDFKISAKSNISIVCERISNYTELIFRFMGILSRFINLSLRLCRHYFEIKICNLFSELSRSLLLLCVLTLRDFA